MCGFRTEIVGACLAIMTGVIVLMVVGLLAPFHELVHVIWRTPDSEIRPLINVGLSGAIYSLAVVAFGILGLRSAKWGGLGLVACAAVGYLFGSRNPTIPSILLVAAALCLAGWYRSAKNARKVGHAAQRSQNT